MMTILSLPGTGTAIGDPTEANTLGQFFSKFRNSVEHPNLFIGSVKSNIGHTESAAGIAGLIKVLLMMTHEKIVPSVHVKKDKSNVNKKILIHKYNMDIAVDVQDWPLNARGERMACVNSFGFGGSNCHAIVFQHVDSVFKERSTDSCNKRLNVIGISGQTEEALVENLEGFGKDLDNFPYLGLNEISSTSLYHRDAMKYRTLVYGRNINDIKTQIRTRKGRVLQNIKQKNNLIFLYCGVGTTWTGMCREMMEVDVFKEKVQEIDRYLEPLTHWRVKDKFSSDLTNYNDQLVSHICIFSAQVALTCVWKSWNIVPDAIVGQSVGEVAAAYASGIIPLDEAVRIIYQRSKVLAENTGGSMMVIGNMPVSEIESMCANYKNVDVAVYSSQVACTLSGDSKELSELEAQLRSKKGDMSNYIVRKLKVETAFHSSYVDNCKQDIQYKIGKVQKNETYKYPIFSTVSGRKANLEDFTSGTYWAENVRKPVLLYQALEHAIIDDARTVVLEIGPRQVFRAHLENVLQGRPGVCLPSMNAGKELSCFYDTLTYLYTMGYTIKWDQLKLTQCVPAVLPRYRFLKTEQLFLPDTTQRYLAGLSNDHAQSHQYIRHSRSSSGNKFDLSFDKDTTSFVFDHFLSGTALVPGATYVDVAFYIGSLCLNRPINNISVSTEFRSPLMPPVNAKTVVHVSIDKQDEFNVHLKFYKADVTYAMTSVKVKDEVINRKVDIEKIVQRCDRECDQTGFYQQLQRFGFTYGPSLQLAQRSLANKDECLVFISVPGTVTPQYSKTAFHPSVVDSVFQSVALLQQNIVHTQNFMPKGVQSVQLNGVLQKEMLTYTCLSRSTKSKRFFNSLLLSMEGFVIAEFHEFVIQIISTTQQTHGLNYQITHSRFLPDHFAANSTKGCIFALEVNCGNSFSRFENVAVNNERFKKVTSPAQIDRSKATAIVVYTKQNQENSKRLIDNAVHMFEAMKNIMLELSQMRFPCPLFVITSSVHTCQNSSRGGQHILDSLYWGLIRSVRQEGLFEDIRLVGVDFTMIDTDILLGVLTSASPRNAELTISGTEVSHISVSEEEDIQTTREIAMDPNQNAILQSTNTDLHKVWFKQTTIVSPTTIEANMMPLRMLTLVRYEQMVFTNCQKRSDPFHFGSESGHMMNVLALEGTGLTRSNEEVTFCYPIKVTAPVVYVPEKCAILKKKLVDYKGGTLCLLSYIYKIVSSVKERSNVLICGCQWNDYAGRQILEDLLKQRHCYVHIFSEESVVNKISLDIVNCLVMIGELSNEKIVTLLARCPTVQKIITVEHDIPVLLRSQLCIDYPKLSITAIHGSDVFTKESLSEIVPCVLRIVVYMGSLQRIRSTLIPWKYPINEVDLRRDHTRLQVGMNGLFRKNACYIIVGGLTGLGWILLQYMAELGAGHIAIFCRSNVSEEKETSIKHVERTYRCQIHTLQVDVSIYVSIEKGFHTLSHRIGHIQVRGIFQGAGIISDALLQNQSKDTVYKVFAPKVQGSWNLHNCSLNMPLDFFVMHSSITSIMGNIGQSNYGAANSFMDSLAEYRRSIGLCGQSLNWGPIATEMTKGIEKELEAGGFRFLSVNDVKRCFIHALLGNKTNIVLANVIWNKAVSKDQQPLKYVGLVNETTQSHSQIVTTWNTLDKLEKEERLIELMRKTVCQEILVTESELDNDTPLSSLGFDSMSSQSFTTHFFSLSNVRIPIVKLLSHDASIDVLVGYCMENLPETSSTPEIPDNNLSINAGDLNLLENHIPYTQNGVLQKYKRDKQNRMNVDVYEVEIIQRTSFKQWMKIIKNVLMVYPQLRTRYIFSDNVFHTVVDDFILDNVPELAKVSYPVISRDKTKPQDDVAVTFDVEREHPVKFQVAFKKSKTYLRILLHKVISDMNCLSLLFSTIGRVALAIENGTPFPVAEGISIPETLKGALISKWGDAETFWKGEMTRELKPITMGKQLVSVVSLGESYYQTIKENMTEEQYCRIERCLQKHGLTFFHLSASLYQLLLHLETSDKCISVNTLVDIRGHVAELKGQMLRCLNTIAIIAEMNENISLGTFLNDNSVKLRKCFEYGFYPEDLIMDQIDSTVCRDNLCRHFLIMDNLQTMNEIMSQKWKVELKRILHRRTDYETKLITTYDTTKRHLSYEFGFSAAICGLKAGQRMMKKLRWMLVNLDKLEYVPISQLNQMYTQGDEFVNNRQSIHVRPKLKDLKAIQHLKETAKEMSTLLRGR